LSASHRFNSVPSHESLFAGAAVVADAAAMI
jgi:hypothetical protein